VPFEPTFAPSKDCFATVIADPLIIKGATRSTNHDVTVEYVAPFGYVGPIELQLVVRNLATGTTANTIGSQSGLKDLAFDGLSAVGSMTLLSSVVNGNYSVRAVIKASGAKYSERFTQCSTPALALAVITEYVDFVNTSNLISVVRPSTGYVNFETTIEYFAASNVKFVVQVSCFVPVSERVGDLANCDGSPRFVKNVNVTFGAPTTSAAITNADVDKPAVEIALGISLFRSIPTSVDCSVSVRMGSYDGTSGKWTSLRAATQVAILRVTNEPIDDVCRLILCGAQCIVDGCGWSSEEHACIAGGLTIPEEFNQGLCP
jgi:hypothetical protein